MTAIISSNDTKAVLKLRYKDGVEREDFDKAPTLYKMLPKATDFDGESYTIALNTDGTQGVGATVTDALAGLAQSQNAKFVVTRIRYYSLARMTGETMKAAKGAGALLNLWEHEVKEATYTLNRELAIQATRAGTGSRAQLATASSNVASATVTLQNAEEANLFSINMYVQGSNSTTDNGTLVSTNAVLISGIDRAAGTLTTTGGNWSTQIPGLTDGYWLHRRGDATNAGTSKVLAGFKTWIGSSAALFGLTRTTDAVKYGGQTTSVAGSPLEEVFPTMFSKLQIQGAMPPNLGLIHPKQGDKLRKALVARSIYVRNEIKSSIAGLSFKGFEVEGPGGTVTILEDINMGVTDAFATRKEAWKLHSLGPCPQVLDFDTQEFLRVASDDAYEIRIGMYGNQWTDRPVDSIVATSVGS